MYSVVHDALRLSCSFLYCSHDDEDDAVFAFVVVAVMEVLLLLLRLLLYPIMAQLASANNEHSLYCTLNKSLRGILLDLAISSSISDSDLEA